MGKTVREKERSRQTGALARLDAELSAKEADAAGRLWASMGRRGLLGWSIPASHGGGGASFVEIREGLDAFVRGGGRPGTALSWAVHLIVGRTLVAARGNRVQKREILPAMASGRQTVSIALSEPGAGSDPKRIRTRAVRKGSSYVLNGEKAWLTNGPMAGLFIVFAVTAERGGKKEFTAFLVPKDTPGLSVAAVPPLGYLAPASHCMIRLEECAVPETAVLGRKGRAWEELSKPFRVVEDILLSGGAVTGGLERQLQSLIGAMRRMPGKAPAEAGERIGEAAALLEAARRMAGEAAGTLDGRRAGTSVERLLVCLHLLVKRGRESLRGAFEALGDGDLEGGGFLGEDIDKLIALGIPASRARQRNWGYALLNGKETP